MQKINVNKKNSQQILATLVMGMNFINTIAPMAEAAQKIPESTEHLTQIPTSEAKPLEYTVLPQALKFVDNLIFCRAEAQNYVVNDGQNISVSEIYNGDGMEVLSGGTGNVNTMSGGYYTIYGGEGTVSTMKAGGQSIHNGGIGSINTMDGIYMSSCYQTIFNGASGIIDTVIAGRQYISSGGIGTVDNMNGGTQTIYSGGTGNVNNMNGGSQYIKSSGMGIVETMNDGTQYISSGGVGMIEMMGDGRQDVSNGGKGTVKYMVNGEQYVYDEGFGETLKMAGGEQRIGSKGNGIVYTMDTGGQFVHDGGIGYINNLNHGFQSVEAGKGNVLLMNDGAQLIKSGGDGFIKNMNGGLQIIYKGIGTIESLNNGIQSISGGTALNTNLYGGTQLIYGGTALNTTIYKGTVIFVNSSATVNDVTMTGGEYLLGADGGNYSIGGTFEFTGGKFNMTKAINGSIPGSYENLTIDNLQQGGGTFIMDTDLDSEIDGDKIVLDNAAAGTSYIQVNDTSLINGPVEGHKNLLLVTVNNGTAAFAGKELNNGGLWTVTPTIENGVNVTDAAGNVIGTADQWYLTHVVRAVNKDTQVLLDGADSSYALWRNTNDTLRKRLGDLRYRSNKTDGDGIWARYTGGKFGSGSFDGSYNMYQLGYDKADNAKSTYGIAVESGTGRGDYDFGSTKDKLWSGSLYGTWYGDNGSYTDVVARIGEMDTDMKSYGDYPDKATAKSHVYSLSVEYGKMIELSKKAGTFIEPQAQFIVGRLGSSSYTTDRGNNVYLGGVNSYIGRIGFTAGQKTPDGNDVYFKASLLHEFGGSRDIHMKAENGETMSVSREYRDSWFEVGLGTNIHLSKASYFYGDIERSFGGDIEKKWQINAGVRFEF